MINKSMKGLLPLLNKKGIIQKKFSKQKNIKKFNRLIIQISYMMKFNVSNVKKQKRFKKLSKNQRKLEKKKKIMQLIRIDSLIILLKINTLIINPNISFLIIFNKINTLICLKQFQIIKIYNNNNFHNHLINRIKIWRKEIFMLNIKRQINIIIKYANKSILNILTRIPAFTIINLLIVNSKHIQWGIHNINSNRCLNHTIIKDLP